MSATRRRTRARRRGLRLARAARYDRMAAIVRGMFPVAQVTGVRCDDEGVLHVDMEMALPAVMAPVVLCQM